jgi:biopolymer transport protein ExbD/biopolymer transport protein TolR
MGMDLQAGKGKPGRASPQMNVTPLVDVVLVLLIIFMVVTPLLAKQFWLHLPDKVEKEERKEQQNDKPPVVVFVSAAGEIQINREVIAPAEFSAKLTRVLSGSGQRTVFFDADADAPFAKAVEAMDLARAGGAATIAVLTEPIATPAASR